MVAEGGVFSLPSNGLTDDRAEGRRLGVSLKGSRAVKVGVDDLSGGLKRSSRLAKRVKEDSPPTEAGLSGDRSGDRSGDLLSKKLRRSLTLVDCSVCMRLW